MHSRLLLPLQKWWLCQFQLLKLRVGPPTKEGRNLEFSTQDLAGWYLIKGQVTVKTPGITWVAHPGEWLFVSQGRRHQVFSDDAQLLSIAFRTSWGNNLLPTLDLRPGVHMRKAPTLNQHAKDCCRILSKLDSNEWHYATTSCHLEDMLEIESWFYRWLASSLRLLRHHLPSLEGPTDIDPRVDTAYRWLEEQPLSNPSIDMRKVSSIAGLSPGHLNQLFLQYYHVTIRALHENRRHQYACRQLQSSKNTIKQVASELGFTDLSKFSRWFRRMEAIPPREYQRQLRKTS